MVRLGQKWTSDGLFTSEKRAASHIPRRGSLACRRRVFYSTKAGEIAGAHPIGERLREPLGPAAPRACGARERSRGARHPCGRGRDGRRGGGRARRRADAFAAAARLSARRPRRVPARRLRALSLRAPSLRAPSPRAVRAVSAERAVLARDVPRPRTRRRVGARARHLACRLGLGRTGGERLGFIHARRKRAAQRVLAAREGAHQWGGRRRSRRP